MSIWRKEGLKVPKKQPKRVRLWLNNDSYVRLKVLSPRIMGKAIIVDSNLTSGTVNGVSQWKRYKENIYLACKLKVKESHMKYIISRRVCLLLATILIISCSVGFAHCQERQVTYAFDKDFPPFSYLQDGVPTGFDIELIEAIFEDTGVKLCLKPMLWEDVQEELSEGKVDLTSGMAASKERVGRYQFVDPHYASLKARIFTRGIQGIRFAGDLKGKVVATQRGSRYHSMLRERGGIDIVTFDTESEALRALWNNQAEAFVGADKTAYFNIERYGYKGITGVGTPLEVMPLYFVLSRSDDDLLQHVSVGLKKTMKNGVYDAIYQKWFAREITSTQLRELIMAAQDASTFAYAPYSQYPVGAAVLTMSGTIYSGCNIENALYGLTASALQVAIFKAISEGESEIKAVINVLPDGTCYAPTADERQILYELEGGILVIIGSEETGFETYMVSELLPFPFELER